MKDNVRPLAKKLVEGLLTEGPVSGAWVPGPEPEEEMDEPAEDSAEANEERFQDMLEEMLMDSGQVERTESFASAGVMSRNKGLVVRLPGGLKFQVTIVQDRRER